MDRPDEIACDAVYFALFRVVEIAESGVYNGTATMDVAEIRGSFDGQLTARSQLVIYSTGRVSGQIRYGKIRWRIEHDYRELKTGLGLDHFEGRSFTGWHRHATLVTAAHLFITTLRLDPKADAPA